jgi:hypothetical protein
MDWSGCWAYSTQKPPDIPSRCILPVNTGYSAPIHLNMEHTMQKAAYRSSFPQRLTRPRRCHPTSVSGTISRFPCIFNPKPRLISEVSHLSL